MQKVAFLGLPGSFSHIAAELYFNKRAKLQGFESFEEIFGSIERKEAKFGVLPIENTLSGSIYESYDLLLYKSLKITGELELKVSHRLYGKGSSAIKRCFSHPEVFKQCRNFFRKNPQIEKVFVADTSRAALKLVNEGVVGDSSIGSPKLEKLYGLKLIKRDIQDNQNNYTRFVIVGKKIRDTGNKVSLVFSVEHKPGSLLRTLEPYARRGMNLTKIESRPIFGKPWEYIFFVDFIINHPHDLPIVLSEMKENVNFITVLGRYEKGKIYES